MQLLVNIMLNVAQPRSEDYDVIQSLVTNLSAVLEPAVCKVLILSLTKWWVIENFLVHKNIQKFRFTRIICFILEARWLYLFCCTVSWIMSWDMYGKVISWTLRKEAASSWERSVTTKNTASYPRKPESSVRSSLNFWYHCLICV